MNLPHFTTKKQNQTKTKTAQTNEQALQDILVVGVELSQTNAARIKGRRRGGGGGGGGGGGEGEGEGEGEQE